MTYVVDFNGREVRVGDKAQLMAEPWDAAHAQVQEVDAATDRVYLTFDFGVEGWYSAKEIV